MRAVEPARGGTGRPAGTGCPEAGQDLLPLLGLVPEDYPIEARMLSNRLLPSCTVTFFFAWALPFSTNSSGSS